MKRFKSLNFWAVKALETLAALLISVVFITYMNAVNFDRKDSVDPETWFEVNDIFIPNHVQGSNPVMIYDRSIRVQHRGFWIVEAQRQARPVEAKFFNECSGSGVNDYEPEDVIPDNEVTWSWFFGRDCKVPPGTYRVQLTKEMMKPGWPVKRMQPAYSNAFEVYAQVPVGEETAP